MRPTLSSLTRLTSRVVFAAIIACPLLGAPAMADHSPFVDSPGTITTSKGDYTITTTFSNSTGSVTARGTTLDVVDQQNTGCSLVLLSNRKEVEKTHGSMCLGGTSARDPLFMDEHGTVVAYHLKSGNNFSFEAQQRSDKGGVLLWLRRGAGYEVSKKSARACKVSVKDASRPGAEQTWSGTCLNVHAITGGVAGEHVVFQSDAGRKMQVIVWTPDFVNNFKTPAIIAPGVTKK